MKIGNNEVRGLPLGYAQHSCMYSRTFIVKNILLKLE